MYLNLSNPQVLDFLLLFFPLSLSWVFLSNSNIPGSLLLLLRLSLFPFFAGLAFEKRCRIFCVFASSSRRSEAAAAAAAAAEEWTNCFFFSREFLPFLVLFFFFCFWLACQIVFVNIATGQAATHHYGDGLWPGRKNSSEKNAYTEINCSKQTGHRKK